MASASELPAGKNQTGSQLLVFKRQSIGYLLQSQWWARAFRIAADFAPQCWLCGLGLAAVNIGIIVGNYAIEQQLHTLNVITDVIIGKLLCVAALSLLWLIAIIGFTFWLVRRWLVYLTAFAHAWLSVPGGMPNAEQFRQSIKITASRQKFLTLVWLFASIYLLVPVVPLVLLIALKIVTGPGYSIAGQPLVLLPKWFEVPTVHSLIIIVGGILSIMMLAYSLVVTVVSAVSTCSPFQTATRALKLCFRHIALIAGITLIVSAINLVISTPYVLLSLIKVPVIIKENLWPAILAQVWIGVSSLVLWPVSLAPVCEIIRIGAKCEQSLVESREVQ